jgi:hypothetical protein
VAKSTQLITPTVGGSSQRLMCGARAKGSVKAYLPPRERERRGVRGEV